MSEPNGERELSTRRDSEQRGALAGQRDPETRLRPPADVTHRTLTTSKERVFRRTGGRGRVR